MLMALDSFVIPAMIGGGVILGMSEWNTGSTRRPAQHDVKLRLDAGNSCRGLRITPYRTLPTGGGREGQGGE